MPTTVRDGAGRRGAGLAVVLVLVAVALWWMGGEGGDDVGPVVTAPPPAPAPAALPEAAPEAPARLVEPEPVQPGAAEPATAPEEAPAADVPAEPAPFAPTTLRVRVVDAGTNVVPGALVRVWPDEQACEAGDEPRWLGYADGAGRCTVTMLADSNVLVASAAGTGTSGMWTRRRLQFPDRVVDGESIVTLVPTVRVTGTVLHADERPAPFAEVEFWMWGHSSISGDARTPPPLQADASGRFELEVDAYGYLGLRASLQGVLSSQVRLERPEPGSEHDVLLRLPGAWGIGGLLRDAAGRPVADGEVRLWRHWPGFDGAQPGTWPEEWYAKAASTDAEGRFAIDLDRLGAFVLAGFHDESAPSDTVVAAVDEGRPWAEVTLRLHAPVTIRGHVLHADGGPAAGVTVYAGVGGPSFPAARNYGPTPQALFGFASDQTDEQGAFELGPLHPRGRYRVTAVPDPDRRGGRLSVDDVPGGASGVELVLDEAALRGAWVHGVVTQAETGEPVTVFSVEVGRRVGKGYTAWRDDFQDEEGRFRIEGLTPDQEYLLRFSAPGRADALAPPFPASEEGRELRVGMHVGGRLEVEVRDAQGRLVPLARVHLRWLDLQHNPWGTNQLAGEDGRAVFEGLPAGDFRASAVAGESRGEAEVSLPADGTVFAPLTLAPAEAVDDP